MIRPDIQACPADVTHVARVVRMVAGAHDLSALYCVECRKAWIYIARGDKTRALYALNMNVWKLAP